MKKKTFHTKLLLKKSTVSNLNTDAMDAVKGGCVNTYPSCGPTPPYLCESIIICSIACQETRACTHEN